MLQELVLNSCIINAISLFSLWQFKWPEYIVIHCLPSFVLRLFLRRLCRQYTKSPRRIQAVGRAGNNDTGSPGL